MQWVVTTMLNILYDVVPTPAMIIRNNILFYYVTVRSFTRKFRRVHHRQSLDSGLVPVKCDEDRVRYYDVVRWLVGNNNNNKIII